MWVSQTGKPRASDLELRWVFELAGSGLALSHAQVGALDGRVLALESKQSCFSESAKETGNSGTATVQTNHNGAQSFPTFEYRDDAGRVASIPENSYIVGYVRSSSDPVIDDFCVSSGGGSWSEDDAREAATMFWGVLEADEYLRSLSLSIDDAPWSDVDGDEDRRVSTIWVPESLAEPDCTGGIRSNAYGGIPPDGDDPTEGGQIIAIGGAQGPPTNPAIMAHEYGHLLLDWARRLGNEEDLLGLRESGSIKEGFSDVFALASMRARLPSDPFWPCLPIDGMCIRDLEDPLSTGHPDYYGLDPYVDYSDYDDAQCGTGCSGPDNDNCGKHDNSTILGHWAYLLGTGSNAGHGVCGTLVEPLSEDEGEAYRIILDVLLNAAARRVGPLVSFEELKDATLVTAEDLYPGTDVEAKMRRAWLAVGLEKHPLPENLTPLNGQTGVEPWLDWYPRLSWKAEGTGPWEMPRSHACGSVLARRRFSRSKSRWRSNRSNAAAQRTGERQSDACYGSSLCADDRLPGFGERAQRCLGLAVFWAGQATWNAG